MPGDDTKAVQSYYADSFALYIDELTMAVDELEPFTMASGRINGTNEFGHVFTKLCASSSESRAANWNNLRGALLSVWKDQRYVRTQHVARLDMRAVAALFERVGHGRLSRLEREERDEAVCWLVALTHAVVEHNEHAQDARLIDDVSQQVIVADPNDVFVPSDTKTAAGWAAPPAHGAFIAPSTATATTTTTSSSSRNLAVVLNHRPSPITVPFDRRSSVKLEEADDDSLSDVPTDTRLSPPARSKRPLTSSDSSLSSSTESDSEAYSKKRTQATKTKPKEHQKGRKKHRKSLFRDEYRPNSTKATTGALKFLTSTGDPASTTDRPHRDRKIPTRLLASPDSAQSTDWYLPPSVGGVSTGVSASAVLRPFEDGPSHGSSYAVGSSVWAHYPNYSWWPSIVLPASDEHDVVLAAGLKVQGKRIDAHSYLVKSLPTGGDWRWVTPSSMRPLERDEAERIMTTLPDAKAPRAWRKFWADLVEGLIIALDGERLKQWAATKTELEKSLELQQQRKKELRHGKLTTPSTESTTTATNG